MITLTKKAAQHETLAARSAMALACIPDAPYKNMLTQLHADMQAADAHGSIDHVGIAFEQGKYVGARNAQQVAVPQDAKPLASGEREDYCKKVLALYAAINNLLSHIGFEGSIEPDHGFVTDAMDALRALDGGIYWPGWTDQAMHLADMLAAAPKPPPQADAPKDPHEAFVDEMCAALLCTKGVTAPQARELSDELADERLAGMAAMAVWEDEP